MDFQKSVPRLLRGGLEGLDPRFLDDPRFEPLQRLINQAGKLIIGFPNTGQSIVSKIDPGIAVKYLADLDPQTISDDMWSVTRGGHKGTSEGDRSSDWFIRNSNNIVGNSPQVTNQMVEALRNLLLQQRYGELRQTHPGKKAYSPHGLED